LPHPANDNFGDRIRLMGGEVLVAGTTVGAHSEAGESAWYPQASTWWTWTAEEDADVWIWVASSGEPLKVNVYLSDNWPYLGLVALGNSGDPFRFQGRPGEVYHICVGADRLPGADYTLSISVGNGRMPNDAFAGSEPLSFEGDVVADNRRATREFREPQHAGHFGGRSLWYKWTPSRSGTLSIQAADANYLLLAAYTGNSVTNLAEVASTFIRTGSGELRFQAEAGTEYRIAVDNALGAGGETTLSFGRSVLSLSFAATPEPPPELAVSFNHDGAVWIRSQAPAILETSTDLATWAEVETPAVPRLDWTLPPTSGPVRFFRVRLP
jgi:hypothetical protein